MIPMSLKSVQVRDTGDRQYLELAEVDGERSLMIVIGYVEVRAIERFWNEKRTDRPLTHELISHLLGALDVKVERVMITELREGTFYALIRLVRPDGEVREVDARPSDAIAIATAMQAPIYVDESVIEEAAKAI